MDPGGHRIGERVIGQLEAFAVLSQLRRELLDERWISSDGRTDLGIRANLEQLEELAAVQLR